MADRLWRAQVSIPLDSLIPQDQIVNTWYFDDDDDPVAGPEDTADWIATLLSQFYNVVETNLLATNVGPQATIRMYDMADPEPRQVVETRTFALGPGAGSPLPNEVALCLSFAASLSSGQIAARRRGRIYLGPVGSAAAEIVGSQSRPSAAVRDAIAAAAGVMADGLEHPGSPGLRLRWSIYSPTTDATSTLGEAFNDVLSGWVDDAWDTQRRRGPAPTTRSTF